MLIYKIQLIHLLLMLKRIDASVFLEKMKIFLWILSIITFIFFAFLSYCFFLAPTDSHGNNWAALLGGFLLFSVGLPLGIIDLISFGYYLGKNKPQKGTSPLRILGLIIFILAFLVIFIVGIFWWMSSQFPK